MIVCIFALDGLSLGYYLCGVSWYWVFIYFYCDGYHWISLFFFFFGVSDIIDLYHPDAKISGKFEIIRVDIPIFAYTLMTISIFDRIEAYC